MRAPCLPSAAAVAEARRQKEAKAVAEANADLAARRGDHQQAERDRIAIASVTGER